MALLYCPDTHPNLTRSRELRATAHRLIPGGAHTYAKGDDQFPELAPGFMERGEGCHAWDVDGNEYIEYGMGLRSVTLGHGFRPVAEAAARELPHGTNFSRPAALEVRLAEAMLGLVPGAEMVKFAKHGSDCTTAAVKLARRYTGRSMVAVCRSHPFFSTDDWFIGATEANGGIPDSVAALTAGFDYGDLNSLRAVFDAFPRQIAAVVMEAETGSVPPEGYLAAVKALCEAQGTVLVFDEMITGFRWHNGGAQAFHGVTPHLSAFGKGMANGFSVSALAGLRDILQLGAVDAPEPRVFLLSTTHGGETHALAAALATIDAYRTQPVIEHMWRQGQALRTALEAAAARHGLERHIEFIGRPCNLVYGTRDRNGERSLAFRTLFMQELARRGVVAPSFVVSYSHSDADIAYTAKMADEAMAVYRRALEDGVERYLLGPAIQRRMTEWREPVRV